MMGIYWFFVGIYRLIQGHIHECIILSIRMHPPPSCFNGGYSIFCIFEYFSAIFFFWYYKRFLNDQILPLISHYYNDSDEDLPSKPEEIVNFSHNSEKSHSHDDTEFTSRSFNFNKSDSFVR